MYRIELSPGEETAFRSIEELAVAVRRGVVTTRARIWHNATGRWLPIQFHPHYKIAASMQLTSADLVAGAPVKPLELMSLGELMDTPAPPTRPVPQAEPFVRPLPTPEPERRAEYKPERKAEPKPEPKRRRKAAAKSRTTRAGRRPLHVALVGALLIASAHLAFSAALAAPAEDIATRPRSHRRLVTTPTNTIAQGSPETTAANVLPGLPAVPHSGARSKAVLRPSLESQSEAATPPLGAFQPEPEAIIQPAPGSVDIAAPVPLNGEALARTVVDSTGKKTLKGILRTIGGTPSSELTRPKR